MQDSEELLASLPRRLVPAAGLLNTLGMPLEEYTASLAECTRARLLQLIPTLKQQKLRELLDATFEHIRKPEYEPVVSALLRHTMELPPTVTEALADPDSGLMDLVPLQCRHRVWTQRPELFVRETHGHILDYTDQAKAHHRPDLIGLADHSRTRQRRAEPTAVQELLHLTGTQPLYLALREPGWEEWARSGSRTRLPCRLEPRARPMAPTSIDSACALRPPL